MVSKKNNFWVKLPIMLTFLIVVSFIPVTHQPISHAGYASPAQIVVSLGDSITKGANVCEPWKECPEKTWSTGTPETNTKTLFSSLLDNSLNVNSIATKIGNLTNGSGKQTAVYNNAKSYTKVDDLVNQATIATTQEAEFVTILSGANDICMPTVDSITPSSDFRTQVRAALTVINTGLPKAKILVASIPNIYNLWDVGHTIPEAVNKWEEASLCPSMLSNPTSMLTEDVERRNKVTEKIIGFNHIFAEECAKAKNCLFDDDRLFNLKFTVDELSPTDFFHPNIIGQQKISDTVWDFRVGVHSLIHRSATKKSSVNAPTIEVVSPQYGDKVSGDQYRLIIEVSTDFGLERVYVDTQIGGYDLEYDKTEGYWFLELDTTLVYDGLSTTFTIVAVDTEGEVTVTEPIKVTVDNSDWKKGFIDGEYLNDKFPVSPPDGSETSDSSGMTISP